MLNKSFNIFFYTLLFLSVGIGLLYVFKVPYIPWQYVIIGLIVCWVLFSYFYRKQISEKIEILSTQYAEVLSILQNSFNYLLIAYLILLLAQEFEYLTFVNANYLLIAVIITGVFSVFAREKKEVYKPMTTLDVVLVWALGCIGGLLIFVKTQELGWLSYVISSIAAVLIVLMGYLVYEKEEEAEEELKEFKPSFRLGIFVLFGLLLISGALYYWQGLNSFRIVFGSFYVLFLPGYIISFCFMKLQEIDLLERIALSFALSIAVVPLLVFYCNLIGMKINVLNVSLVIFSVIVLASLYIWKQHSLKLLYHRIFTRKEKHHKKEESA